MDTTAQSAVIKNCWFSEVITTDDFTRGTNDQADYRGKCHSHVKSFTNNVYKNVIFLMLDNIHILL